MATTDPNAITKYMHSETVKARFAEVVGERNAGPYIASVMLAVANDDSGKLKQCTPSSVYISALRAASLRLSVDPATGQAYLIPYKDKATLIVGYKGLQDMAVRTGRYRYINVSKMYEGEEVIIDRISGAAKLAGNRTGKQIIGWLASFEMINGYSKVIYMTVEEIHAHAEKYNPNGYNSNNSRNAWKTSTEEMERKTVLRILLRKWGYLDPSDVAVLEQVEDDSATIEAEVEDLPDAEPEVKKDEAQLMAELGFGDSDPTQEKVSDAEWMRWLALCNRAEKVEIAVRVGKKYEYTPASLEKTYATTLSVVTEAEHGNHR